MTKQSKLWKVSVVGATGVVGNEFVKILEERNFPLASLKLLASERSLGKTVSFKGKGMPVDPIAEDSFKDVEIAFFTAGSSISKEYVPAAVQGGAVVIDNTAQFRMEPDIPLVVPEVNPEVIADYKKRKIIANPNCSTIQLVVVLNALHQRAKIKRVVVSTYQSVSGAGLQAMDELSRQSAGIFSNKEIKPKALQHQIAFNLIPHIDVFLADGTTKEEWKVAVETSKIMETNIPLTATTVRVPVFYSHSEAVNVEFVSPLSAKEARELLKEAEGVEVVDDPSSNKYPLPIDAAGKDAVFVGRIREDKTVPHGLNLWVVADNVRKGAALNAVQIAEILIREYL